MHGFPKSWAAAAGSAAFVVLVIVALNRLAKVPAVGQILASLEG